MHVSQTCTIERLAVSAYHRVVRMLDEVYGSARADSHKRDISRSREVTAAPLAIHVLTHVVVCDGLVRRYQLITCTDEASHAEHDAYAH
jgi:hypothetical protein